jgi:dipeptidyl aminopeptidase/acylaminoacyl peptidase
MRMWWRPSRRGIAAVLAAALSTTAPGLAQAGIADGALLSEEPCAASSMSFDEYVAFLGSRPAGDPRDTPFDEAAFRRNHPREWFEALGDERRVRCRRITYGSDGLRVTGFIVEPAAAASTVRHPAIVFNRGGNRMLGAIRIADLMEFAGWALDGYVVVASQYRGNDGGEGREEFGGADVADVLNVLALARRLPSVDPERVYMYGFSRGGMMTYLALAHGAEVRAAAVLGGPGDLEEGLRHRPEMETVYRDLMPEYDARRAEHLRARSAAAWPERLSVPLLILHGGADWRVWPGEALAVAAGLQRLGRPYELVVYAGDDHPMSANLPDVRARLRAWFARDR